MYYINKNDLFFLDKWIVSNIYEKIIKNNFFFGCGFEVEVISPWNCGEYTVGFEHVWQNF